MNYFIRHFFTWWCHEKETLPVSLVILREPIGHWWIPHTKGSQQRGNNLPSWWRHQMEAFSALLAICAGNSLVPDEFPAQRPVTRSFDGFFDLRLNKRLSKQSWGWWFQTLSRPLWRHCNDGIIMWGRQDSAKTWSNHSCFQVMLLFRNFTSQLIAITSQNMHTVLCL